MGAEEKKLDAHASPPQALRQFYKTYQKSSISREEEESIIDFDASSSPSAAAQVVQVGSVAAEKLMRLCEDFETESAIHNVDIDTTTVDGDRPIYASREIPGLQIIPRLLPPSSQLCLLSKLLHRDLSNPQHQTNVHAHYSIPYPGRRSEHDDSQEGSSFFIQAPTTSGFVPKDPNVHKPINLHQCLDKKLRWMTLGGQYDWTRKVYPEKTPPTFPDDIARLLQGAFPSMRPEAAIVNFYSAGDTLSLHRDVSEQCDNGLISVSLGCDGLFIVGLEDENYSASTQASDSNGPQHVKRLIIRLHSGDAVYMSGRARYAWHGVPRIIRGTCPAWMQSWPAIAGSSSLSDGPRQTDNTEHLSQWDGWMASKRINLNVRQMFP